MTIMKKIGAIALCGAMVLGTMPSFTALAVDEPTYIITNQDFEADYGDKKITTDKGNTIIFYDDSLKTSDNRTSNKNYISYTEKDGDDKKISLVKDKALTGRDGTVLQILRDSGAAVNLGNRFGIGATEIPNAAASTYFKDRIVQEFEFCMTDIEGATSTDMRALEAGYAFSSSGWHLYQIHKDHISFSTAGFNVPYSQVGFDHLKNNTWYKIKEVVDVKNCTMSLYIDDMLLATQVITAKNIISAPGRSFSRTAFSLSSNTVEQNTGAYKVFIDNLKVYSATTTEAEKMEVESIKKQIAKKSDIYLPAKSNKIYTDDRDANGCPTTTTTTVSPKFSFTSSNTDMISNNGDWNLTSPKGNEPDLNMTLTVKSGSTTHVETITKKREILAPVTGSTFEMGKPVAVSDANDIGKLAVESYVTSTEPKNATMYVVYYDESDKIIKVISDKENIDSTGKKLSAGDTIPDEAKTAKVFLWDDNLKPAISPNGVEISDIPVKLSLPDDFGELETFTVTKKSSKVYTHDATPENQIGGQTVTVHISHNPTSATGLGMNAGETISYKTFSGNCTGGLYDSYFTEDGKRRFILEIADPYYTDATSFEAKKLEADLIIRSTYKGADGEDGTKDDGTWAAGFINEGSEPTAAEFTLVDGSETTYMTTLSEAVQIARPMNPIATDDYGMPKPYKRAEDLDKCKATAGTFYQPYTEGADSNKPAEFEKTVYVHPYEGENIEDIKLTRYLRTDKSVLWVRQELGPYKIIFDNIKFGPFSHQLVPFSNEEDAKTAALMFFDCKFFGGENNSNALHINSPSLVDGKKVYTYNAYLFNCIAAYGGYDGFNYQGRNGKDCKVVEINCKSYNNGTMYFVPFFMNSNGKLNSDGGKNYSNNGTTSHYGMKALRVGGEYWNCQGGIVADVDSYTINIGCVARNRTATSGNDAAFMEHNDTADSENFLVRPNYYIDCHAEGSGITNAFAAGTGDADVRCYDCTKDDVIANLTATVPSAATGRVTVGIDGWNTLVKEWQNN